MRKLSRVYTVLIFLFLYAPILVLIVASFNTGKDITSFDGFTLHQYAELFKDRTLLPLLRNSVGIFGVVGVLGFCAVPFLRLGVQFLLYKLAAALSATLSDHPASRLIQDLGSVFALVMGMAGTCALVTLFSLISTISAVMP